MTRLKHPQEHKRKITSANWETHLAIESSKGREKEREREMALVVFLLFICDHHWES